MELLHGNHKKSTFTSDDNMYRAQFFLVLLDSVSIGSISQRIVDYRIISYLPPVWAYRGNVPGSCESF